MHSKDHDELSKYLLPTTAKRLPRIKKGKYEITSSRRRYAIERLRLLFRILTLLLTNTLCCERNAVLEGSPASHTSINTFYNSVGSKINFLFTPRTVVCLAFWNLLAYVTGSDLFISLRLKNNISFRPVNGGVESKRFSLMWLMQMLRII